MGVHVWGQPCDVESLTEIADKHQLKLMFDASHAFGCSHQGKTICRSSKYRKSRYFSQ